MIDLIISNIAENSNKINAIAKCINRMNNKHFLELALVVASFGIIFKIEKYQEERIDRLEMKIKEMKSKGE